MLKSILNLEGVKILERLEKGNISGGNLGNSYICESCPGECGPDPCNPELAACIMDSDPTLICLEP